MSHFNDVKRNVEPNYVETYRKMLKNPDSMPSW